MTFEQFADEAWSCPDCAGGERWYAEKHAWIRHHARQTSWSLDQACAAYAVLSMNTTVQQNDDLFVAWAYGGRVAHFGDVLRRLALVEAGDLAAALTFKKGRKVRAFAHNLRWPRRDDRVTIDRHSARIVVGGCAACGKNLLATKDGYDQAKAEHVADAQRRGVVPNAAQARAWVHLTSCLGGTMEHECERHKEVVA
jgi:hypothetical protein